MIQTTIKQSGIVFKATYNGHPLHFKEWSETDDCIYYLPLATLVDNGNASYHLDECIVPFESLYLLDDSERTLLGIPEKYDKAMRLRGEGLLNASDFQYKIELLNHIPDGELLPFERQENIIQVGQRHYMLSECQWQLFCETEQYNQTAQKDKTTDFNLRQFAHIKMLAQSSGCQLDSYLENENVFVPDTVRLEIGRDGEGFTILPHVEIEDAEKFTQTFDRQRKVLDVYPVQNERGERTRVVLSPKQRDCLKGLKVRRCRFCSREDIQNIVEHPTEYFDPDQFDLKDFYSDRVIEIGVYKPKFYPFVCPYESCWVAGAMVETPANGTARLAIKSQEELDELKEAITKSSEIGRDIVDFRDTDIDIEDARYLADIAERQLKSPKKPIEEKSGKHVLIIEENAEVLGYEAKLGLIETGSRYTLFTNQRLADSFSLKEHQQQGVAWLQHLYKSKASGCLMADDMGLGKTLQVLYFIDWHSQRYPNHKPYLIVAPISLLENWELEYHSFFPTSPMKITRLTSKDVPRTFDKAAIEAMQKMDIVLTNYDSLRISQLNFCAVEFDVVVLDEAQNIKTPGTLKTNAAKALKGKFKIAMTGTPVENTLVDLWSIMDFAVPGLLGNAKEFAKRYQSPLKNEDADIKAMGNELHQCLGIYFMRRMKSDVAKELPEKHEIKRSVEMPMVQRKAYKKIISNYTLGIQPSMLQTIYGIRTVSEHPYLYDGTLISRKTDELTETSARLQATLDFLDNIKHLSEKVIIFVERKESQRMLQRLVHERYGIIAKIINGDTPTTRTMRNGNQSRQSAIDEFQDVNGFNVIIMSPIAAGMGLNITGANHVIHFSRHWNPAKESQATDRAYRIGQTKNVYVYYPMAVCKDFRTFDVSLDDLLSRKTSLATSTIFPTERIEVRQDELGKILFNQQTIC